MMMVHIAQTTHRLYFRSAGVGRGIITPCRGMDVRWLPTWIQLLGRRCHSQVMSWNS